MSGTRIQQGWLAVNPQTVPSSHKAKSPLEAVLIWMILLTPRQQRRGTQELLVRCLHALLRQRAGVLDGLLADLTETGIHGGIIRLSCFGPQHTARAELRIKIRCLRVVDVLRLLLRIEMVKIAEEFIEATPAGFLLSPSGGVRMVCRPDDLLLPICIAGV
jgi:hypothetical protein